MGSIPRMGAEGVEAGKVERRSFASPFGAPRAPRLGDRVSVEFAPLLGASAGSNDCFQRLTSGFSAATS
jgi:hypothetical protein